MANPPVNVRSAATFRASLALTLTLTLHHHVAEYTLASVNLQNSCVIDLYKQMPGTPPEAGTALHPWRDVPRVI
jgi:hypothetical protein